MNEVEKMYENAGIKKEVIPCPAKYYGYDCTRNNWDDEDCSCDIEEYPSFTAEKQLELIKWMLEKYTEVKLMHLYKGEYFVTVFNNVSYTVKNFEDAIASFINNLWQDLTEEERTQIKEILE